MHLRILGKLFSEEYGISIVWGVSVLEGADNGLLENRCVVLFFRQDVVKVIVVLHTTALISQVNHGMHLFCNHRLK